jgi:hypothetical protein
MFLLRLNKRVSPALVCHISLTVRLWFCFNAPAKSAEFYNKIAGGISSNKALYANGYSALFHRQGRSDLPRAAKNIFSPTLAFSKFTLLPLWHAPLPGHLSRKAEGQAL